MPSHEPVQLPLGRLWFGMGAPAVAWSVHGFFCFVVAAQACKDGLGDIGPLSAGGVRIALGLFTLAALGLSLAGAAVAWSNWRRLKEAREVWRDEAFGREDFMCLLGILSAVTFTMGILLAGIPLLLMNTCVNAR